MCKVSSFIARMSLHHELLRMYDQHQHLLLLMALLSSIRYTRSASSRRSVVTLRKMFSASDAKLSFNFDAGLEDFCAVLKLE